MSSMYISLNESIARPTLSTPVASLSGQISATATAAGVIAPSNREVQPAILDAVDFKNKTDEELRHAKKKNAEGEDGTAQKLARGMSEILFAYNFRGDLRIQFMDSVNKVVYQTPPLLFARMTDIMHSSQSVDMTV